MRKGTFYLQRSDRIFDSKLVTDGLLFDARHLFTSPAQPANEVIMGLFVQPVVAILVFTLSQQFLQIKLIYN